MSSSRTPTAEQGAAAADAAPRRITLATDAWHPTCLQVLRRDRTPVRATVAQRRWRAVAKDLLTILVLLTTPPSCAPAEAGGTSLRPMR